MSIHYHKHLFIMTSKLLKKSSPSKTMKSISSFPTFLQIKQIYNQQFKPIQLKDAFIETSTSKLGAKADDNNETLDNSQEVVDSKSFDCFQGFEDFTYDSEDFKFQTKQQQEYIPIQSYSVRQKVVRHKPRIKERKIRTTITKDKLQEMNIIFKQYQEQKDKGKNPTQNLKAIGQRLGLGYSTILHKFRQFRQNKEVKGGALLESLQKKRKYGKSRDVQRYIEKSLRQRPFYTAVELSKFIRRKFGKQYTRSIISRHLTEMGYSFNNIKPFPIEKNAAKYIQARRLFANIIEKYTQSDEANYIFIDEVAFSKNLFARYFTNFIASAQEKKANEKECDYVSLIVAANSQKIHYFQIKNGFLKKGDFRNIVLKTSQILAHDKRYTMEPMKKQILLTDIHRIHYDDESGKSSRQEFIAQTLNDSNMTRFFLPPGSPQLNPLESFFSTVRERLNKEGITDQVSLRQKLQSLMKVAVKQPTCVYFKEFKMWMHKAKHGENF